MANSLLVDDKEFYMFYFLGDCHNLLESLLTNQCNGRQRVLLISVDMGITQMKTSHSGAIWSLQDGDIQL